MRILHLAFEDHLQPGSGGGSVRTRELDRRLAERHEIVALTAGYPGASERFEDGVRYIPIGTRSGTKADRLAYFAALPRHVRRIPHDLVLDEFSAPFSVSLAPLYTRKPVVASVQWMFAESMWERYRLPFHVVERHGLRLYDRFIAVSEWLAGEIRRRRPGAAVRAIPNGVEPLAFEAVPDATGALVFVGRLDIPHKGLDLLVDAYARVREALGEAAPPLHLVGDGPDEPAVRRLVAERGLEGHVRFRGRVDGAEKYALMAGARAIVMPSRWETFGMVAAEGLATGAAVVAFDVGPLREVVGDHGTLAAGVDADTFAAAVLDVLARPQHDGDREARRAWARRYDWDRLAGEQEAFLLESAAA